MHHVNNGSKWNSIKKFLHRFDGLFSAIKAVAIITFIMFTIVLFAMKSVDKVQIIYVDTEAPSTYRTSSRFLSITLDSSTIADGFKGFNMTATKLIKLVKYLSPAYLRIGGTLADRLLFSPDLQEPDKRVEAYYRKYYDYEKQTLSNYPNFTMTGSQWLQLTKLAERTNLDIVFDLNALIRFANGSWDYRNAESLIKFSNDHNLRVNWELGNEPDLFPHMFNEAVNASQLAQDVDVLRHILNKYPMYNQALLVGPDTTRPRENDKKSQVYLKQFLRRGIHAVDAITWHQYYLNGRTAQPEDFVDPKVFDLLKEQIGIVKNITSARRLWGKPLWLGETSSAYGGGAPNLSDAFIGTFIWLDKLGLAAKMGINVVMRQSVYKGHYALLDEDYNPNPDWWVSVLYKKLVGTKVVPYYTACSPQVRLYCHCTKMSLFAGGTASVTVFGMNLANATANVRIEGLFPLEYDADMSSIYAFELTTVGSVLSKDVYLNGKLLRLTKSNTVPEFVPKIINGKPFVTMPPFSIVFWVVPTTFVRACVSNYF